MVHQKLIIMIFSGQLVPQSFTEDGLETTFASNYLGHFLMIDRLLPLLQKSRKPRLVIVSSDQYRHVTPHVFTTETDWLREEQSNYNMQISYARSKLAGILMTQEFSRRYQDVSVLSIHPGEIYEPGGILSFHDFKFVIPTF